jgi:hypothetical protein
VSADDLAAVFQSLGNEQSDHATWVFGCAVSKGALQLTSNICGFSQRTQRAPAPAVQA